MGKLATTDLVFIASPLMGHLMPAVELARLMIHRDEQLSVTFLLMKLPFYSEVNAFIDSLAATANNRLHFHQLPPPKPIHEMSSTNRGVIFDQLIEYQKPHVRETVAKLINVTTQRRLGGFLVDLLGSTLIEVADEFGVPSYVYFTSGAAFLGLTLHFQTLQDELNQDTAEFKYSDTDLVTPCLVEPVPPSVLPSLLADSDTWKARFLKYARGYRKAKGIIINTFADLESHPLASFSNLPSCYGKSRIPTIYAVGPIIHQTRHDNRSEGIIKWLDDQPPCSVVFICFGSMGSFGLDQVGEIANGIVQSGYRFVWVLRQPPAANKVEFPGEYMSFEEVLPEGFLDQTVGIGKVVGWVPQVAVLSHRAIGGFVSHCGWNSILESLWCGVPILTWPLYAEQKLNAFQMVKELGLAVEIPTTMSDKASVNMAITAELIEKGIRRLMMEGDAEVIRRKVREMREKSRMNMQEGGSSYTSLGNLIRHVID